jgi:Fe2+ or Zn2+ uptake regulation protein
MQVHAKDRRMQDPLTRAVVRQLLAYASAHPSASDSAAGIQRWWLDPAQGIDMQTLNHALNWLVSRGVFSEQVAVDGRRRYRRSGSDAELAWLLAELGPSGPRSSDDLAADPGR